MMFSTLQRSLFVAAIFGCFLAYEVEAAEPAPTTMYCSEMCGGCVKKITKHFDGATGIAELKFDVPSKSVTVVPAPGYQLSARALWEAMDQIGKTPVKLVGPTGTFTSKPKQ